MKAIFFLFSSLCLASGDLVLESSFYPNESPFYEPTVGIETNMVIFQNFMGLDSWVGFGQHQIAERNLLDAKTNLWVQFSKFIFTLGPETQYYTTGVDRWRVAVNFKIAYRLWK